MRAAARRARIRTAQTAVLFAALAAEAYVNEFLSAHGALEKWDREPTHRKYLEGTREAYGSQLFFADREAYPEIVALLKLRESPGSPQARLWRRRRPRRARREIRGTFCTATRGGVHSHGWRWRGPLDAAGIRISQRRRCRDCCVARSVRDTRVRQPSFDASGMGRPSRAPIVSSSRRSRDGHGATAGRPGGVVDKTPQSPRIPKAQGPGTTGSNR
jgi:hypothetical protein